jgi:hypothetical protein
MLVKDVTRVMAGALALAVAAFAAALAPGAAHAQDVAVFKLSPQDQTVNLSAGTATVDVRIENVSDMAAFQFVLRYDRGVLKNPTVQRGPFLGSTGRNVQCPAPVIDADRNGLGTVQYSCVTLQLGPGVSGSGLLATVTFELAGGSQSPLVFYRQSVTNSNADSRCAGGAEFCGGVNGGISVAGGDPAKNLGLTNPPEHTAPPVEQTPQLGVPITDTVPANGNGGQSGESADPAAPGGTSGSPGAPGTGAPGDVTGQIPGTSGAAGTTGSPGTSGETAAGAEALGRLGAGPREGTRVALWIVALALVSAGAGLAAVRLGLVRMR